MTIALLVVVAVVAYSLVAGVVFAAMFYAWSHRVEKGDGSSYRWISARDESDAEVGASLWPVTLPLLVMKFVAVRIARLLLRGANR